MTVNDILKKYHLVPGYYYDPRRELYWDVSSLCLQIYIQVADSKLCAVLSDTEEDYAKESAMFATTMGDELHMYIPDELWARYFVILLGTKAI